jgi:hypothetical protein
LGRSLCHLQLLGNMFAHHIARPSWQRRETSLQASRRILTEGNIGQPRSAEPGPQLKSLLERFPILLLRRIFNSDGVVTFADFMAFFGLALALFWNIYMLRRGSWFGDKLRNVILQQSNWGARVLTDKTRIPLRSASVRTPHLFHHGIPKVLDNPRSKGITSA